jgi:hypothetical protein
VISIPELFLIAMNRGKGRYTTKRIDLGGGVMDHGAGTKILSAEHLNSPPT